MIYRVTYWPAERKRPRLTSAIRHEARRQAMSVVRHRRERQRFGQMAAAIRTALPATASADPEPLTNEMQAHGLMALMRSPIHLAQGTAHELPKALYRGPFFRTFDA